MEACESTCKFIKLCCIYSQCRSIKLIVRPVNLSPLRRPVIVSMKLIVVKCKIVNVFDFLNKARMLLMPWGRVSCISKTACFLVNCASLFPSSMDGVRSRNHSKLPHPSELDNQTPPAMSNRAQFGA